MEENVGAFDDWRALVSSPKVLVPGFVSEEFHSKPMSEALDVEKIDESVVSSDKQLEGEGVVSNGSGPVEASSKWKSLGIRLGGSIAERRAAKCGFNAARINTARFRSTSPLSSPAARSPYLTIPPGISPTALLDSPMMLPNSQAQPSPTTGTFTVTPLNHESSTLNSLTPATDGDRGSDASSLHFKPHESPVSLPCISGLEIKPQIDFEFPEFPKEAATKNFATESSSDIKVSKDLVLNANCLALQSCHTSITSNQMPQHREPVHGDDAGAHRLLEGGQKGTYPPMGMGRTSEDGYNWRKYGQKQVKGSEFPRSYYKCTHPNCQVKKKVERSHDGQITEIIYKGAHNHPKPQPNRRSIVGSPFSFNELSDMGERNGSGGAVWRNIQLGCKDIKVDSDWRADGLERTSSTSVVTEVSDPLSTTQGKCMSLFESAGTPELSSTLASHDDDEEDGATQGSISLGDDADDGESELKRRKKDSSLIETNFPSRALREPRVVVQIESEVDILDDGYRWRKYGQKVVKGNPNPRSYYKCTSAGCSVRKHVERASQNLKCVITSYEGKHNHEVPAARNSSHVNSGVGNVLPAASNTRRTLTLSTKPEAEVQDLALNFERKPELGNEFMKPNSLGNFGNDLKFGASFIYQMKFPPLPSTLPYGSFVLNPNHGETHPASSIAPVVPDFPMSLPLPIPRSANIALGGFDFNNHGKPVQSILGGKQLRENDTRLLKPKQEQKDECLYDTGLPVVDHANRLSSSSINCRIMRSFPS
uniref:Putative WRKY transcription factor 2 n=1 Tax=Davidia involucrata TaxID=16924 RepID=A0A5B6ZQZ8_DAVIN